MMWKELHSGPTTELVRISFSCQISCNERMNWTASLKLAKATAGLELLAQ
jgi:hypothetical protein